MTNEITAELIQDQHEFNKIKIKISCPSQTEGYRIYYKTEHSDYIPFSTSLIPSGVTEIDIIFDPETPELTKFWFKVVAQWGGKEVSEAIVVYQRTLYPVKLLSFHEDNNKIFIKFENKKTVLSMMLL